MRKKIVAFIITIVIILILIGLIRQIVKSLESGKRLDQASSNLVILQEENRKLKLKYEEVLKIGFIEEQARNKLNLARPNEVILVIPEDQVEKLLNDNKDREIETKIPNWQGWFRLIFHP